MPLRLNFVGLASDAVPTKTSQQLLMAGSTEPGLTRTLLRQRMCTRL